MKKVLVFTCLALMLALSSGCTMLTEVAAQAAAVTGKVNPDHVRAVAKTGKAAAKAFDAITPQQEYFLGRSVTASVLANYKPYDSKEATRYINLLGQTLALKSDKPFTYDGYRFLIMDTDEINAFAAPGGFILVSRGLLRCCPNEDALAAVLAHEVGHIQHSHGLSSIKKGRWTTVFTTAAAEAGKALGPAQIAELTAALEGSVSDITQTMVKSGYARKFEVEADRAAVMILRRTGYNPNGLKMMLEQLHERTKSTNKLKGFAKTHPDALVRLKEIEPLIRDFGPVTVPPARAARFKKAMAGI